DRPGDAQNQLAPVEAHVLGVSPSSLTRYSTLAAAISSRGPLVGFLCRVAAIELTRPLRREDDQQVAVRDLVQRAFKRGECHQLRTSRSGRVRPRRMMRQRSARMIDSSWSRASFTSRFTIR